MIILIKLVIVTSLLILGYTIASQEEMVLHSVRVWAEKKYDEGWRWLKPVFLCIWCMASVWSLFGFVFAYQLGFIKCDSWNILWYYPLCVCGSSLLSGLTWTIYTTINAVKDKQEAQAIYFENINDKNNKG